MRASDGSRSAPPPASAKQTGQPRLQRPVISIRAVQVCWPWAGHRPQSKGQPRSTRVAACRGEDGFFGRCQSAKAGAPRQMTVRKRPWSWHSLTRKTSSPSCSRTAGTRCRQTGQRLWVADSTEAG